MNREKKEKEKKKKIMKKYELKEAEVEVDETEVGKTTETGNENWKMSVKDSVAEEEKEKEIIDPKGGGKKNFPEGFYIEHPRNIKKRTDYFQDVHSRKLAELLEAFHMFDFDRDGIINKDDLRKTFISLNMNNVEDEQIDQMLLEVVNPLNFDAFVILLGYKTLDLDPEEVFVDALSNWDDHREGFIPYERLLRDIVALGDKFTEEEAYAALADAPIVYSKTKEKMIDYVQFSEDLCGLRKMMQKK